MNLSRNIIVIIYLNLYLLKQDFLYLLDEGEFTSLLQGFKGSEGVVTWPNGTLIVNRADKSHEGRYLCEASNGVATGVSKLVTVNVHGK